MSGPELLRYRALALATGGALQHLEATPILAKTLFSYLNMPDTTAYDNNSRAFLTAVDTSEGRTQRQRQYQALVESGEATKFDWYKEIPR